MPTPIEMMVDAACGVDQTNLKDQADALLKLADAAVAWYREDCIENPAGPILGEVMNDVA